MKLTSRGNLLSKWSQVKGNMTIDKPLIKLTTPDGKKQFLVKFSDFEKGKLLMWLLEDKKAIEFYKRNILKNNNKEIIKKLSE